MATHQQLVLPLPGLTRKPSEEISPQELLDLEFEAMRSTPELSTLTAEQARFAVVYAFADREKWAMDDLASLKLTAPDGSSAEYSVADGGVGDVLDQELKELEGRMRGRLAAAGVREGCQSLPGPEGDPRDAINAGPRRSLQELEVAASTVGQTVAGLRTGKFTHGCRASANANRRSVSRDISRKGVLAA